MRAREWAVVGVDSDPAAYGIPELPNWRVHCDDGGIAFAADDDDEPFVRAESPVRVRR